MKNFNHINVENLLNKVENFYKVFYINKLIVGIFSALGLILGIFLTFDAIFYYSAIPTWFRFTLFYGFIVGLVFTLVYWVLLPLSKLFKLRSGINNEEIGKYVGTYFEDIGDSLINTLQLQMLGSESDLVQAVISQNSKKYDSVDFKEAVPKVTSKINIYLSIIPLVVLFMIWLVNPNIIVSGTNRMINYETDFSKIAPYNFEFSKDLKVYTGETCSLTVKVKGEVLPNEMWVNLNGQKFRMKHLNDVYSFEVVNLRESGEFWFTDGEFNSGKGFVEVIPKSEISSVDIVVEYPKYTKEKNLVISNPTVLKAVKGSFVVLSTSSLNFDYYSLSVNDSICGSGKGDLKGFKIPVLKSCIIDYVIYSKDSTSTDGFSFEVNVVEDLAPGIEVKKVLDSDGVAGFVGEVWDDYGFRDFSVRIISDDSISIHDIEYPLGSDGFPIFYDFDYNEFSGKVSLQFLVRDNDFIGGYKESTSQLFSFNKISDEQKDSINDSLSLSLKKSLVKEKERIQEVELDLAVLRKELIEKDELSWSDKNELERLLNKMKASNKELDKIEKNFDKIQDETTNSEDSEKVAKQKEQLSELLSELRQNGNKDLLEELEKLLKEFDKDELTEQLKSLEENAEKFGKDLDRELELFKQLEVEQGFNEVVDSLKKLSEDIKELANDSLNLGTDEKLQKLFEQESDFDDLMDKLDKLDSLNNSMKDPYDLDTEKDLQKEITDKLDKAAEDLEMGDSESSKENQEDAADKMDELLDKLEESGSMEGSAQEAEDLEALRKILENLLELSFREESNMLQVGDLSYSDPRYNVLVKEQVGLKDDMILIKDSLYALSYRVPQISGTIEKEVKSVDKNLEIAVDEMNERNRGQVRLVQQKGLTSMNNLAVLLDEVIQQMQNAQKSQKKGDGSCSKPGQGKPKPSLGKSKKKQDALAKEMEKMKKSLEKGKSKGGNKPGKMGSGMSKEVAKMAAEQGMIRDEVRKLREQLQKEGKMGDAGSLKELEKLLEKNEDDLIDLNLSNDFINRQQEIEIKLLEAHNAELERELDSKRESGSVNLNQDNVTLEWVKYIEARKKELEILRRNRIGFTTYYKGVLVEFENVRMND